MAITPGNYHYRSIINLTGQPIHLTAGLDNETIDPIGEIRLNVEVQKLGDAHIGKGTFSVLSITSNGPLKYFQNGKEKDFSELITFIDKQARDSLFLVNERVREYLKHSNHSIGQMRSGINIISRRFNENGERIEVSGFELDKSKENLYFGFLSGTLLSIISHIFAICIGALIASFYLVS